MDTTVNKGENLHHTPDGPMDRQGITTVQVTYNITAKDNACVAAGDRSTFLNNRSRTDGPPKVEGSRSVADYTRSLKAAVKHHTQYQPKLMTSPVFTSLRTDDIFTNVLMQRGRKSATEENHHGQAAFRGKDLQEDEPLMTSEEIFLPANDDTASPKSILLIGKPGIGKTLFCQKLVRDWACDRLFNPPRPTVPEFQFVFLLTFRQLSTLGVESFTLREVLNRASTLDDHSNIDDSLYDHILHHPENVLIILDGYDEYANRGKISGDFEGEFPNDPSAKMPVAALCAKLMKGKMLRDAVTLVTSRPDESDEMGDINFDLLVEIAGFSKEQVREYIAKFFKDDEEARSIVSKHIMSNENLVSFGHIPVLCYLMCWYMKWNARSKRSTKLPLTMTDLYSGIVQIFELKHHSGSDYKAKSLPGKVKVSALIDNTLEKLSKLAAQLLLEKKLIFEDEDMERCDLSPEELELLKGSGLLYSGPLFLKSPFEVSKEYSFTHLTIQEYLAACWFAKNNQVPSAGRVSVVVLQFLSGILSKTKNNELMEKVIQEVFESSRFARRSHVLLTAKCLYEYKDLAFAKTVITGNYEKYCFEDGLIEFRQIADEDFAAVSFLLDAINSIEVDCLPHPATVIKKLCITYSTLSLDGMCHLVNSVGSHFSKISELRFEDSALKEEAVEKLCELITNKLRKLDLSYSHIKHHFVGEIWKTLTNKNCKLSHLGISRVGISEASIDTLCEVLSHANCNLRSLSLRNTDLSGDRPNALFKALTHENCKVTKLDLSFSGLTNDSVVSLCEALSSQSCVLRELILSGTKITQDGYAILFKGLTNANCKLVELCLGYNNLSEESIECLCKEVLTQERSTLAELSLPGNYISENSLELLRSALIHKHSTLTAIDLSHSELSEKSIMVLLQSLANPGCKLTTLHLARNNMKDNVVLALCNCLKSENCKLEILDLSYNPVTDASMEVLAESLKHENCKLTELKLSWNIFNIEALCAAVMDENCKIRLLDIRGNIVRKVIKDHYTNELRRCKPDVKLLTYLV